VLGGRIDIHNYAREAEREFPEYRVIVGYAEAELVPSIHIYSTAPFARAKLARLVYFAERRGLQLSVGGDPSGGLALHVATLTQPR
jgi:hypothetical protein